MPIMITSTAGGLNYANPLVNMVGSPAHVKVDISGLTVDEVDAAGYLKPGVMLTAAGVLVGASGIPFGITFEAQKLPLATVPPTNTTLGTETGDCLVTVCTAGLVNRDIAEDGLGRAFNANELAGFVIAGSKLSVTTT